ncbi:hypothetical protein RL72_01595 [Microbacterium azadirachtae]|uniref:Chromosome partition protein Smc n=1 Tax=Microbacterium azadirachtae TaxID=582680 RepID=A0A0F0KVD6_9MICO|nr:hypothetical protein [Microbacterium azadirachtae]KJL24872.1 hypothetical protein RL72_01595 [Microbacterium azadirachtae]
MNDDLQETIKNAVAESVTIAMKSAMDEFSEVFTSFASQVDARFDAVDDRLDTADTRMDRIELRLDGFEGRFDRLEGRLENLEDSTRGGFDRVNTTLDGIVARLDDDEVERAALTAQMNRHEDWIVEAAPLVRVDYTPGS